MRNFNEIDSIQELKVLVGFFDLTNFARYTGWDATEMMTFLSDYYEFTGDIIEEAGGTVVKFMGDAALIIFPETHVNEGVVALRKLQTQGDAWLAERGINSRNKVTAHFGEVACGPVGTRHHKSFDVFGIAVNTAARLNSNGFAMTAQVFRQLDAETRNLLKKHTPPITYIPVEARHQD
jgi:class 3 adenylate cyclase